VNDVALDTNDNATYYVIISVYICFLHIFCSSLVTKQFILCYHVFKNIF